MTPRQVARVLHVMDPAGAHERWKRSLKRREYKARLGGLGSPSSFTHLPYIRLRSTFTFSRCPPQVAGPLSVWHGDGYEKLFQKHGFYVRGPRRPIFFQSRRRPVLSL